MLLLLYTYNSFLLLSIFMSVFLSHADLPLGKDSRTWNFSEDQVFLCFYHVHHVCVLFSLAWLSFTCLRTSVFYFRNLKKCSWSGHHPYEDVRACSIYNSPRFSQNQTSSVCCWNQCKWKVVVIPPLASSSSTLCTKKPLLFGRAKGQASF